LLAIGCLLRADQTQKFGIKTVHLKTAEIFLDVLIFVCFTNNHPGQLFLG